jgi:ketosteroid isomerase-like protein
MNSNEQLIHHFYSSFQNKDVKAMQECYADHSGFSDPVFVDLSTEQVRAMWAMLLKSGKDLRIEFKNVCGTETGGTAEWDAYYTFSATGNKVINRVRASFIIKNHKITRHKDQFHFYTWARQALGLTGILLGWTGFLRDKVRTKARKNLEKYMASNDN